MRRPIVRAATYSGAAPEWAAQEWIDPPMGGRNQRAGDLSLPYAAPWVTVRELTLQRPYIESRRHPDLGSAAPYLAAHRRKFWSGRAPGSLTKLTDDSARPGAGVPRRRVKG